MAEKRPSVDNEDNSGVPRKRKAISLALKKQIINLYEGGYGPSFIARDLNFSISTISSILKDKDRIKEHLKGSVSLDSAMITKRRSVAICEMEKQLMKWIEQEAKMGNPQTQSSITNKAYSIYDEIYSKFGDENKNFAASPGWFRRFKARTKCPTAEDSTNLKSANGKPVDYVEMFWKKTLKDKEYDHSRIFKLIETDFFWKRLPDGTCHSSDDNQQKLFTSDNDSELTSMLLCGNIAGTYKHKPLLIFPTRREEFDELGEENLPIYYRINESGDITKQLFEDWFTNCFTPEVETYCKENNLPYKIILVLNKSKWYNSVEELNVGNPHIKILTLPTENVKDRRSFDRFVTLHFRAYYLQCLFVQAIEESENDENFKFLDFWKNYDAMQTIYNVDKVWSEMNMNFLSAMCTLDVDKLVQIAGHEKSEKIDDILDEITKLGDELKLKLKREGVIRLIDRPEKKEKIIVVLNGVNQIVNVTKVADDQKTTSSGRGFNSKELTTVFYEISSAMRRLQRMEHDQERFLKVKQQVQDALLCYRKMLVFKNDE